MDRRGLLHFCSTFSEPSPNAMHSSTSPQRRSVARFRIHFSGLGFCRHRIAPRVGKRREKSRGEEPLHHHANIVQIRRNYHLESSKSRARHRCSASSCQASGGPGARRLFPPFLLPQFIVIPLRNDFLLSIPSASDAYFI